MVLVGILTICLSILLEFGVLYIWENRVYQKIDELTDKDLKIMKREVDSYISRGEVEDFVTHKEMRNSISHLKSWIRENYTKKSKGK